MIDGNPNRYKPDEAYSLEAFYHQHHNLVYRAAYSVTHSRQDAEDVVQSVFLNVLRHPERTETALNIKGFLFRAAVNEALHVVRTRERQRIAGDQDVDDDMEVARGSPIEDTIRENLSDAVTQLKPEYLEVLTLTYQQGYNDTEIAGMLGCTLVNVAVIRFRARAQLRKLMARQPPVPAGRLAERFGERVSPGGSI